MKKLALLGAGIGLTAAALLVRSQTSHAADHLDAPALATGGTADITDVYAWMTSDDKKINLILDVSPAEGGALGTHHFDNTVQYVFHVTSHPGTTNKMAFAAAGTESRVICTFESDTSVQCWVVTGQTVNDYVKGDPSNTTGIQSASHKTKVFAGKRSDPFFFNLAGLKKAIAAVEANAGILTFDAAGCPSDLPAVGAVSAQTLRTLLSTESTTAQGPCPANQIDCFKDFNVLAIVVQLDADLVLQGSDHVFSVWASTHMAP